MPTASALPWEQTGWLEQVHAWVDQCLGERAIARVRPMECVQTRPWSTVWRATTTSGTMFFKASGPATKHEAALTAKLAEWHPNLLPGVVATCTDHGWILMNDAGITMRNAASTGKQALAHWEKALRLYAKLQVSIASRSTELLAHAVPDRRPSLLPGLYTQLLEDTAALRVGLPDGLSQDDLAKLRKLTPLVHELCAQLDDSVIPPTLQHDDLHGGNIFIQDGRYILADWGEACVAPPFFTLVVTLRSIAYQLNLLTDDPALLQLRDTYLQTWIEFMSLSELRQVAEIAKQVGAISRALTWHQIVSTLPEPAYSQYAEAVPRWLEIFLRSQGPS